MARHRVIRAAIAAVVATALGCGALAAPAAAQSLTDRFKSLFGGGKSEEAPAEKPSAPAEGQSNESDVLCPPVAIRSGASTYAVGAPGKEPVGSDLRFQATITRTARECAINGGEITARIGIQGRIIVGPAGAPPTVQVPLRVAVVQGGVSEKTIATKAYQTTVTMGESGSEPFTLVAEDLTFPAPSADVAENYVFYIGFDPQALKPEPKPKAVRKK
ncbi:hypothetical protein [Bradyrhizobium sp. Leo170]|uniref:hypothetical protein n=1 Tax=Bradyrhizobium sp. Leo170 TaxID=1571199 RepID=UPI00102E47E1|nr:hypothetical protein [Bradyrhizobium sp. Leo170]TAI60434.1 hypothetical protein CWO89_40650 [Bradyrhizobium sp. Leo170]